MSVEESVEISRDDLFNPEVDSALAHSKALIRQAQPEIVTAPVPPLRRFLLSQIFYMPASGLTGGLITWVILEPYITDTEDLAQVSGAIQLLFPLTGMLIVLFIFTVDGLIKRTLTANIKRILINTASTVVFSFLAFIPVGFLWMLLMFTLLSFVSGEANAENIKAAIEAHRDAFFITGVIFRSMAWVILGLAIGLGMTLTRSTRAQRRAAVMGAAVGGALGGLFFDPIGRFILHTEEEGNLSRLIGLCVVGLCVGLFIALSERLGRQGWVRVRTGPLAGKSFILYHNPTIIGSSPQAGIYLFKDFGIDGSHAAIHHAGGGYELVDMESKLGTFVNGRPVRRHKLSSGDQITLSITVLDFEERARQRTPSEAVIGG